MRSSAYPSLVADQGIDIDGTFQNISDNGLRRVLLRLPCCDHVNDPNDRDKRDDGKRKPVGAGTAGMERTHQHAGREDNRHVAEPKDHRGETENAQI